MSRQRVQSLIKLKYWTFSVGSVYWDSRKNLAIQMVVIPLGFKPKTFRPRILPANS